MSEREVKTRFPPGAKVTAKDGMSKSKFPPRGEVLGYLTLTGEGLVLRIRWTFGRGPYLVWPDEVVA